MDDEGEANKPRKIGNIIFNVRHILQSTWLRCLAKVDDRCDRWLLEWNFCFLPIISGVLYFILSII